VNFTPENKSENNTTIPKTIETTTAQISLEDHDELNMVEDIHVTVSKTIDNFLRAGNSEEPKYL
jgi:hypothetical protein